jgi:hypothetical protein
MAPLHKADWPDQWMKGAEANLLELFIRIEALRDPLAGDGWHLGFVQSECLWAGFAQVGKEAYESAVGWFVCATMCECELWEGFLEGRKSGDNFVGAANLPSVLVAFATCDNSVVERMKKCFQPEEPAPSPYPDIQALGCSMGHLIRGELKQALATISDVKRVRSKSFAGYLEVVSAIARQDREAFEEALLSAEKLWVKYVKGLTRGMPTGLPEMAAFLNGVGFQRVAEDVLGWDPRVETEYMPAGLLADDLKPELPEIFPRIEALLSLGK